MFKRTKLSASVLIAFGGAFTATAGVAQQALERVEITGSAIRRVESEGALPVQVLKREDIQKTGATSVTDLLQKLPGIQGATTEGASVGGGGSGFSGVSIHNIGETRTLVLLNGRRLALFGGQTLTGALAGFDLNTLPLAAIDRVEILTDGASALYGSDAIAGVVNFITRRNSQIGEISVGLSEPSGKGATEKRFSITKGFGDLNTDGYNLLLSFSGDKRDPMNGVDRSFSKTGVINFNNEGKRYQAFLGSTRGGPANAFDDDGNLINPYFLANGACAPGNVRVNDAATGTTACYFDFVAALEIFPERERKNFLTSFEAKVGPDNTFFADLLLSRTESTGKIAPLTADISIDAGTPLHDQYLLPNGVTGDSIARWRGRDLGRRSDFNKSEFKNLVAGFKGLLVGWDYKTALGYSESKYTNNIEGYPGGLALNRLRDSGLINPFLLVGEQSQAGTDAINAALYKGYWDGGTSKLSSFDVSASRELSELAGGPLAVAVGFNAQRERFQSKPSLFAQGKLADPVAGTLCDPVAVFPDPLACDERAGDDGAIIPYGADRKSYGLFAELNAPLDKGFEVTGSVRYDHYDDFGSTTNGKASFRWTPTSTFLVRGSVGTGFKAPSVPQVKASPQPYGVTGGVYDQTAALQQIATSLGAQLQPNGSEYDVVARGNPDLKPEKSRQASLGFVFDPVPTVSLGADLWWVGISDAIGNLAEEAVFGDPLRFSNAWTTKRDNATGVTYLAWKLDNNNLGKYFATGIDFNLQGRASTAVGTLTTQLVATYMLREDQQLEKNGPYYNAIGKNVADELGVVTFRWQGRFTTSLKTGNWQNTLQANFKSGYRDAVSEVEVLGPGDVGTGVFEEVRLKVKSFVTFDWQTQWQATKSISLTGGVLNIFNNDPPLSLADGGNGKGQMFGYDDRYYDSRGRTFYVDAKFSF